MKRTRATILIALGAMAILAGWTAYRLDPERRFRAEALPVLVTPQPVPLPPASSYSTTLAVITAETSSEPSSNGAGSPEHEEIRRDNGFNLLLLGVDRRGQEASRTDSIILIHLNPKEKKAVLVSLPRDTRIPLAGVGLTKINHVHALEEARLGNEAATKSVIQAVSNFFQVPIHYFAKTDFKGFVNIIDTIGGVELTIPKPFVSDDTRLEPGKQKINGKAALALSRERFSLSDGDFGRQVDQVMILRAAAEQLLSTDHILKLPELVAEARDSIMDTNLSNGDAISLGWMLKDLKGPDMKHVQVPGKSLVAADPLVGKELWYWEADAVKVREISRMYLQ